MELAKSTLINFEEYVIKNGTHLNGKGNHVILQFPNGYGASIISTPFSYGIEVAVLDSLGSITYDTPITDDVIGYLNETTLIDLLNKIKVL